MRNRNNVEVQPIARAEWEGQAWIALEMREGSAAEFENMPETLRCEGREYGKAHFLEETRTAAYSTRHAKRYNA